ncbi:hypothetical protein Cni_G28966 [Canna indica]|uniref:Uncharacterized protein n=1 Tax=Canna indica TaxID=4628 RepID=A0AAQ3L412_9LILI|nr:hypothetical protein Cni_G28966 [Canna indica]
MGRVAASRSPCCSGGLSNLVLHRASLPPTLDAGDRLVRIRMGLPEDSFSDALLQIGGFCHFDVCREVDGFAICLRAELGKGG